MTILISLSSMLLGEALALLLQQEFPEETILTTGHTDTAVETPDLLLVDVGVLSKELTARWPSAKIVLLDTGLEEERMVSLLLSQRLDGIIAQDTDISLFRRAVSVIQNGQIWIDNGKLKALLNHIEGTVKNRQPEQLSRKEQQIIKLISEGHRNREIAAMLFISEQTMKTHISRIFRKCNVTSRAQLIPLAMKLRDYASS